MYTLRHPQIYHSQVIVCGWMRLQITETVWDEYRYNCTLVEYSYAARAH